MTASPSPESGPPRGTGRVLLGTTSFEHVAGSEILLLELAEAFMAQGYSCDLAAFDLALPMRRLATRAGIQFLRKPAEIRPLSYDLVWLQTQIGPTMNFASTEGALEKTLVAFAHLDLRWKLAGPGVVLEDLVADRFMFPSPEAAAHFRARGLGGPRACVFHNAAPAAFRRDAGEARQTLRRILFVSNHLPPEIGEAAALLRAQGIEAVHWGQSGDVRDARLLPRHLDEADAVVSIGKTVQYALRARVPAYVYDHFGGPGWLSPGNLAAAAWHNFSGRCARRTLSPEGIAREIVEGFMAASEAAAVFTDDQLRPFSLEHQVELLIAGLADATPVEARLERLRGSASLLAREQDLAAAAGHYFAAWRRAQRQLDAQAAMAKPS